MALTTITGRVRGTVRLKGADAGGGRVVSSTWASDRAFPRTVGVAIPFEVEAADGAVFRVDPFGAFVLLPVRRSGAREGVRHEEAWIAVADEITVEGELERAGRNRQPTLLAHRIAAAGAAPLHRLPPRSLQRGESERAEAPPSPEPPAPPPAESPGGQSPPPSGSGRRRPRSPA